ncbi:MAG: malonate decarboxylase holo-ACP synthase [Pseudomonas sp.]|nr:malonate decarboxylase holo-ACP synthase [Pseudomonas sp.]
MTQNTRDFIAPMLRVNAHDLLWGMTVEHLEPTAPSWVHARVAAGNPVVVRRDQQRVNQVAVGIRGTRKSERYATWVPKCSIIRVAQPEDIKLLPQGSEHVQKALASVAQLLADRCWGVVGSYAFEAITGEKITTPSSDLDVLLRQEVEMTLEEAQHLFVQFRMLPIPVDVQIETGVGGFSLADWATNTGRVLLKTDHGPQLVVNPWLKEDAR